MKVKENQRRDFIKKITALGTLTAIPPAFLNATDVYKTGTGDDGNGFTFLFQGDSITDGNRTRNKDWNHVMGHGYAYLISSRLWYDHPKKNFHFFNRGISGNKVTDLAARWQQDTIEIKPDLLSILIGINDTSSSMADKLNFPPEQFENNYRDLLHQTQKQLPNVQLVLCEPFILPVGHVKDNWVQYTDELKKRQQTVKKLSVEFKAIHVEFQKVFNKALLKAPAEYWIWDGIHPMPAGHELMAREWIRQVSQKLKFI